MTDLISRENSGTDEARNVRVTRSATALGALVLAGGLGLAMTGNPVTVVVGLGLALNVLGLATSWAVVRFVQ